MVLIRNMKKIFYKIIFIIYKYYLIFLPFAAYIGVMILDASLCGQLSFFGWLPLAIYYYFLQIKYNLLRPNVNDIIIRILPLIIIGLIQAFIKGSVWSFFVSALIYEICTLTLALTLMLIFKIKQLSEVVVVILAILFLGTSALFTLMALFIAVYQNNHSIYILISLGGAIIVDLFSELEFLQSIIKRKVSIQDVVQSDINFEKNMLWFILALFMWGLGMILIKNIIEYFF